MTGTGEVLLQAGRGLSEDGVADAGVLPDEQSFPPGCGDARANRSALPRKGCAPGTNSSMKVLLPGAGSYFLTSTKDENLTASAMGNLPSTVVRLGWSH